MSMARSIWLGLLVSIPALMMASVPATAQKKPNVVMLMTDDTGWGDFGAYLGGVGLGHPTPNIDRVAKEGVLFTNWYGQASCTAGRASFMTGRIPIRSAMSVVVVPGDPNGLKKETPTIAEFYQKNGYSTYFSGKWHLGDKAEFYPIEHGFDEMKHFGAYYPGVYAYSDTAFFAHPWFPKFNAQYWDAYQKIVNLHEWSGEAGKPAVKGEIITYDNLSEFDMRQTDSAVAYIKQHANASKPFFMSVNFMKMHQPNNPSKMFLGKSHLGKYSDSMMELDYNIGRIMDVIRAEAPDTIVIITADNGAWQDAWDSWIYIDGETFQGVRQDVGDDPETPWLRHAWKYLYTSKDTWLGPELNLGAIGATYNLTMDPYEKYDMTFNGAVSTRNPTTSPGRYAGMDNGWVFSLVDVPLTEFNKSIVKYPNMKRFPGGASNDLIPNLQNPENPLPYADPNKVPPRGAGGG